jgi:PAS domain S-box-containing protein
LKPTDSLPPSDWLAGIFAGSHVAIGISRLKDNRFVAVNDAFEKLFGYRRKDILGRTSLELGLWPVPEERDRLIALLRQSQPVRAFEARYRKRSGETGDLQISASILAFDGEDYMVGLLTDISDRKQAERSARINQMRLATVLQLSDLLVFHQDRHLRYTWIANPTLGAAPEELIGRSDEEILGRQAARPLAAIKRRVLRSGRGEHREVRVTRGDHTGCFDLIVEPERNADGRISGLVCAAADITQRKNAEEHLQLQADILVALEEGVNLIDAGGIIRYTNPKFDAMFGYAAGELLGRHAAVLNAAGEATPEQTARTILRALIGRAHV